MVSIPLSEVKAVASRDDAPDRLAAKAPVKTAEVVLTILFIALAALVVHSMLTNKNYRWDIFAQYLTAKAILSGIGVTLTLTLFASLLGLAVGIALAAMAASTLRPLRAAAAGYIWFCRGTPMLVHLLLWFNLALFLPVISIGIPFVYSFWEIPTNQLISGFTAAILGLGLAEAAYMAEIVRGGLNSVDPGQKEAAQALGLKRSHTMRSVLLPQAMRAIIPSLSNQIILMLKTTSLVSVIAGNDLLTRAKDIYNDNFQIVPLLLVATFWYLVFTSFATLLQRYLEVWFSKDLAGKPAAKPNKPEVAPV
jgi:polar amino acid transport system permease protein